MADCRAGKIARCGTSALPCIPFPFAGQTKNCSQVMKSYRNSTAVRFYRNLFPSAQRSSDAAVTHCSCMSPDLRINTQIPPSQDISAATHKLVSVVYGKRAPLLQWRDRAGLTPASILAFVKFAVHPKTERQRHGERTSTRM